MLKRWESIKPICTLKGRLQIHKQNRIIKYVPSMFRFEKGVNDYIHESISELHYTAPHIYDRKIRAVSTTFTGGNSRFLIIMDLLSLIFMLLR